MRLIPVLMCLLALEGAAAETASDVGDVQRAASPSAGYTDCVPSASQITFRDGYTVSMCIEYEEDGRVVQADAVDYGLDSRYSGLLYFFEADNAEVLVKVLDGCAENGHRWVFVAPVTTLAFNLRVDETTTGRSWTHRNPRGGRTATTASDLQAFPCGSAAAQAAPRTPMAPASATQPIVAGGQAACDPRPVTTLAGGFTVNMCIEYLKDGRTVARDMQDYGLGPGKSALLYAFDRDNAEVLIKVLDGCAVNGHRWVFVAPVTTLAFNLSIEPVGGGRPWTYGNVLGRSAAARSDLTAFPCADRRVGYNTYAGRVIGYTGGADGIEVLLTAQGVLRTTRPDASGWFEFPDLPADRYAVKVRADGYQTTPARLVRVAAHGTVDDRPYDLMPIPTGPFVFHWEEDQSTAGTEYSANVLNPRRITFDQEPVRVADNSSAINLRRDYGALLVDSDEASWTQEHAWRVYTTMRAIPQEATDRGAETPAPSQWLLTPKYVEGDIQMTRTAAGTTVLVSEAAFVNVRPRVVTVDGKRGIWFSKRLHHALVRYVTNNGRDREAYERIFQERYGVTTEGIDYSTLTRNTTADGERSFQRFKPAEIITLLNMLEEFPSGLHRTENLNHLVRRRDPLNHPIYPTAPAVAWPTEGYIEFMGIAFNSFDVDHVQRLILHEKAHFLWAHVLDEQTRRDWADLGGWYQQGDKWFTTKTTEFVSAYAHERNPNEDMAETISFFIIDPDALRSRSIAKYEFVRDRIMQGNQYISQIREDLTFEVYNLFPDYVFPGKIRRVDIRVDGEPTEDKQVRIEMELHALDRVLEGAAWTVMRVFSEIDTYFDIYLYPLDENGRRVEVGTTLVGTTTLDKSAKAGYWAPNQVTVRDPAGNERHQRDFDFGWKLFVRNDLEDWTPPEYVRGSADLRVGQAVVEGRSVQTLEVSWGVEENNQMQIRSGCSARVTLEVRDRYWLDEYGDYSPASGRCHVSRPMPDYMPSSTYSLGSILFWDLASNLGEAEFLGSRAIEPPARARLVTSNPDTEPPELDLNRIEVDAEPANPEAPNGETIVTVRFRVRDDISGYILAQLDFRDPQGLSHRVWAPRYRRTSWFPVSDETQWGTYEKVHVLPPGSAPGTWGVSDMTLWDRAGNRVLHDFTEVIHFDVEGDDD
ncbi:MAG: hypothetical protein F4060_10810 [Holophagales bacterium]|nr:hypothetical protein [Holophagales bacterium]MYG31997.1 hypothetical protein [Holophagales bacterium]MYI80415.1 hypothetical protein [Holophagales bacterium]